MDYYSVSLKNLSVSTTKLTYSFQEMSAEMKKLYESFRVFDEKYAAHFANRPTDVEAEFWD